MLIATRTNGHKLTFENQNAKNLYVKITELNPNLKFFLFDESEELSEQNALLLYESVKSSMENQEIESKQLLPSIVMVPVFSFPKWI